MKVQLTNCKVCTKEVASTANSCPHCGAALRLHPVARYPLKVIAWIGVGVAAIVFLVFLKVVIGMIPW